MNYTSMHVFGNDIRRYGVYSRFNINFYGICYKYVSKFQDWDNVRLVVL